MKELPFSYLVGSIGEVSSWRSSEWNSLSCTAGPQLLRASVGSAWPRRGGDVEVQPTFFAPAVFASQGLTIFAQIHAKGPLALPPGVRQATKWRGN
jgi:hypothetical protein